ncbi:MAG: hypothetical protein QOI11_662 [Candidatus Eremiobacteraeota bacterium]|jgi:hypothetical protein|nr:hypothetical protein [Candidatus Eremiobacteraeota bacterium]
MDKSDKLPYRQPEIVAIGDAVELTGVWLEPVRDNPGAGTPAYYNANPRSQEPIELDD